MPGSFCMSCNINTSAIKEHFMLRQIIWEAITEPEERAGMLCVGCVEKRMAPLRLTPLDFDPEWAHLAPEPSERLRDRRGY